MGFDKKALHIPDVRQYQYTYSLDTRWMDNDVYGHVNNVVYYSYFDTIANRFLIEAGVLSLNAPGQNEQIGLMVNSQCSYFHSIAYPDKIIGGFAVNRIGNSSVEYNLAIFKQGQNKAAACGTMTHVFVHPNTRKPVKISGQLLDVLSQASIKQP